MSKKAVAPVVKTATRCALHYGKTLNKAGLWDVWTYDVKGHPIMVADLDSANAAIAASYGLPKETKEIRALFAKKHAKKAKAVEAIETAEAPAIPGIGDSASELGAQ